MNEESRPGEKAASTQTNKSIVPPTHDPIQVSESRRAWARDLIDQRTTTDLPEYGSARWVDLPPDDPNKIAAVVIAAEAWANRDRTLVQEFRHQVERERAWRTIRENAAYAARWSGGRG
ncbi:MAG: hypothetical protein EOO27_04835 [Comamonadaceae bacterium]|nr:MAG: hypothetical protein EOO27_04835 [Comamonadaceae bacterium]